MSPQCLITGCDLLDMAHGAVAHGDLHAIGNETYIFNATLDERGQTAWTHGAGAFLGLRPAHVSVKAFFERRGVIVFSAKDAELSSSAKAYIAGVPL